MISRKGEDKEKEEDKNFNYVNKEKTKGIERKGKCGKEIRD